MSITQTYYLAHTARGKLSHEAAQADHNLRLLVGHANLLDSLMLELAEASGNRRAGSTNRSRRALAARNQGTSNGPTLSSKSLKRRTISSPTPQTASTIPRRKMSWKPLASSLSAASPHRTPSHPHDQRNSNKSTTRMTERKTWRVYNSTLLILAPHSNHLS